MLPSGLLAMKLTLKAVATAALPAGKTDVIYFDDDLGGFGLRLRAGADRIHRTWVAQYRAHGRTRRMKIGTVEKLTPDEARKAARKVLAKVEIGGDPQADKAARRLRDAHSLRATVDDYLVAKRKDVRPRTYHAIELYLTGPHFKSLHPMAIDRITRRDVAACLTKIIAGAGSPTAVRARGALNGFYVWAMGMGLAEHNPIIGTIKPKDAEARSRVLKDEELAAIWRQSGDDAYGKVIKLLILTGARRGEVGGMRWSEIDTERGAWSLPPERTKNGRGHVVPLSPLALEIIQSVPPRLDRDHLFGTHSANGLAHWHAKHDLDVTLGKSVAAWRVHDVRRTVATRMGDLGVQPHVIEAALNHQSGHKAGVVGIYNRSSYEKEVRAALMMWSDHVRALVEDGSRKIIPMKSVS
jgi:integrase